MNEGEHKLFQLMRDTIAAPDADRDALVDTVVLEAALYSPHSRQQAINNVTAQINDNERSLRERSQLRRLERELSDVHHKLLSVGR